ncbi:hypothetical protein EJB05_25361, partial [Eragrostis curvula]
MAHAADRILSEMDINEVARTAAEAGVELGNFRITCPLAIGSDHLLVSIFAPIQFLKFCPSTIMHELVVYSAANQHVITWSPHDKDKYLEKHRN